MVRRHLNRALASATFALVAGFGLMVSPWAGRGVSPAQAQFQFGGGCGSGTGFQFGGFQFGSFFSGGCFFGGGGFNFGFNFGAFQVLAPSSSVGVGERLPLVFFWEVPTPGVWQDLRSLELRLKDPVGNSAFWSLWEQSSNVISLVDPSSGRVGSGGQPGQASSLESALFTLHLSESVTQNSGPTGQVAAVLFSVSPNLAATGQTYTVEVRATNDSGAIQGFATAGSLAVRGDDRDDKGRPRLNDEQRDQRRRGNTLGSDSLRAEGNVIAAPHCNELPAPSLNGIPAWLTEVPGPWIIYADRDGLKRGELRGDARLLCTSIQVGDYVSGSGAEQNDRVFEFQDLSIERGSPGRR